MHAADAQYMQAVGDLPPSDDEDDDDDEDEDDEDEEEDDEEDQDKRKTESEAGPSKASEPLDEAAFQAQMAARLEALRLHKALGNDDPDTLEQDPEVDSETESEESDSDSDTQSIAAQTDYTTYQRPPKAHKPRPTAKKMGRKDVVAMTVEAEMKARASRAASGGGSGSNKAGKAKGHKWKTSANYLVGKDSGW